ncbi:MAG: sigma-70 family RNA polymerase sigma factor [Armatimonadetes bacterium]|jgi:RNA polymerase sigma-70 factor (ECF subfamily)|nr:sigma-70 family RNA polymerase sigma factor [Armatimonadota bacterium]
MAAASTVEVRRTAEERAAYAGDVALVRSAQAGDLAAFEALFARYHARIHNVVYGMVSNQEDAADLVQDAFVKAYRALGSLRDGQAFFAWLCRIAVNLCRNFRRGRAHLPPLSLDEGFLLDGEYAPLEVADSSYEPARLAEVSATAEAVRKAIETLSPDHREVVVMHHLEGLPVDYIAQVVGVPVGTVKSRLSRGRDSLRRALRSFVES